MANYDATGKKARKGPELASRARACVLAAFDVIEDRGKSVAELLADQFEDNPIKFMELVSKYMPRELNHSGAVHQTHTHIAVSEISRRLGEIAGAGEDSELPVSGPH